MGIKTVRHPPYSPDLAPSDFWLFPKLRGCRYETTEEMKEAVTKVIGVEYTDFPNDCLGYDTKLSDGEAPLMLKLWEMRSTPLLPSLPGSLWPAEVASDRVLSMEIEINCAYAKLNCLK